MTISKNEYNKLMEYKRLIENGHVLTPDGLRFVCSAYRYDAYKIGMHMLETLARFNDGHGTFSE